MSKTTLLKRKVNSILAVREWNNDCWSSNWKIFSFFTFSFFSTLRVGESITIPTRSTNGTLVEGNQAQCSTITSNSSDTGFQVNTPDIVPGQFRIAAIDGSNATSWQPLSNTTSSMVVDLSKSVSIKGLHFNWGNNPPTSYSVSVGNNTSNMTLISTNSVNITAPYNNITAEQVSIKVGNLTDVVLPSIVVGRYVNVSISGSYLADGRGGTLSEFGVL